MRRDRAQGAAAGRGRDAGGLHGGRVPAVVPAGCVLRRRGRADPARQAGLPQPPRRPLLLLAVLPTAAARRQQTQRVPPARAGAAVARGPGLAVHGAARHVGRGGEPVRGQLHVPAARRRPLHPDGHMGASHDHQDAVHGAGEPPGARQVPGPAGRPAARQVPGPDRARPRLVQPAALQPAPDPRRVRQPHVQHGHAGGDAAPGAVRSRAVLQGDPGPDGQPGRGTAHPGVRHRGVGADLPRQGVQQQQPPTRHHRRLQSVLQVLSPRVRA